MLLADRTAGRDNNHDFIRFVSASLVILTHAGHLTGKFDGLYNRLIGGGSGTVGGLGVSALFVVGGFLLARSWDLDPHPGRFLLRRFLRIFPALAAAVLMCMLVVGPLATTLPLHDYFTDSQTYRYLRNCILFPLSPSLPGVFAGQSVNGALWTLPLELAAYGAIVCLGCAKLLPRRWLLAGLGIAFLVYFCQVQPGPIGSWLEQYPLTSKQAFIRCHGYLLAGVLCYAWRDRIPLSGRGCLLLMLAWAATLRTPHFELLRLVALPYAVLWIAYTPRLRLHNFSRWGDFSYGLYIYHFPIQLLLILWTGGIHWFPLFLGSYSAALALAAVSWRYLEGPCLRAKPYPPAPARSQPAIRMAA